MTKAARDIELLTKAERMLAEVQTIEEAANLVDMAAAARDMAQRAQLGVQAMNRAQAIRVKAMIRLADLVDEGQARGQIATKGVKTNVRGADITPDPLPVPRQRLAESRKIRDNYSPDDVDRIIEQSDDAVPIAWFIKHRARTASTTGVIQSLTNEWYTPEQYLQAARSTLGSIDLDPASCDEANATVNADTYYTAADDGLTQPWKGRIWLNPPYGRQQTAFIERLLDEYEASNVEAAIVLVNAHCTDTRWFQPLWDHTLCFTDHRINFNAGTDKRSGSTHGSVFIYLGPHPASFRDNFAQFGAVVRRMQP